MMIMIYYGSYIKFQNKFLIIDKNKNDLINNKISKNVFKLVNFFVIDIEVN